MFGARMACADPGGVQVDQKRPADPGTPHRPEKVQNDLLPRRCGAYVRFNLDEERVVHPGFEVLRPHGEVDATVTATRLRNRVNPALPNGLDDDFFHYLRRSFPPSPQSISKGADPQPRQAGVCVAPASLACSRDVGP